MFIPAAADSHLPGGQYESAENQTNGFDASVARIRSQHSRHAIPNPQNMDGFFLGRAMIAMPR